MDEAGQVLPLGGGEILLLLEPPLQLVHLHSNRQVKTEKIPPPSPDCSYVDMMMDTVTDVWSDLAVTWCDMV